MDILDFWRRQYLNAPSHFKPIIATLGKLIKFGDNATTKDISPDEMKKFCDAVNLKIKFPPPGSYSEWGIPQVKLFIVSERIKQALTDDKALTETFNFDYDAAKAKFIDYLRDVYKRIKGTVAEYEVIFFANHYKKGLTLYQPDQHNLLIKIIDKYVKPHDDLYNRFFDNFIFPLTCDLIKTCSDVDFWQAFEDFTGGCLFYSTDPFALFYFKPDVYRFNQIYLEEVF